MRKVLASLGIGNATVDTVLPSETVRPGESVDADVHIVGGDVKQEVGTITFEIKTRYRTEERYRNTGIDQFRLAEGLTIDPDQDETRSVQIDIPYNTPVTFGNIEVWVETGLDIDLAIDPADKDYLDVRPTQRCQTVFDAMEELGFSLRTAECEAVRDSRSRTGKRFTQEFQFRANTGQFRDAVNEVDIRADPAPDKLDLFFEVERRDGLLSEMAETNEGHAHTTIRSTDVATVRDQIAALIEKHTSSD